MSYLRSFINGICQRAAGSCFANGRHVKNVSIDRVACRPIALTIVGTVLMLVSIGCSDTTEVGVAAVDGVNKATVSTASAGASAAEVTTSVEVSAVKTEISPAKQELETLDADASPEVVCRLFMKYLNSGNRIKAERLLTSVAFDTTAKAGLYLQPMGSPSADVEIGPAIYVTDKQQLAHVDCTITERVDGAVIEDKLTWMVRKSQSGWRIFGMVLTMKEGHQDFLSLENPQDVDTILQISGEDATTDSTRVAQDVSLN